MLLIGKRVENHSDTTGPHMFASPFCYNVCLKMKNQTFGGDHNVLYTG